MDGSPAVLRENAEQAYVGSYILGLGFTFDDYDASKGEATSLNEMHRLIEGDAKNKEVIFPFVGGDEINTNPAHRHSRYVINFYDMPLARKDLGRRWVALEDADRDRFRKEGIVPLDYPKPVAADWPDLLEIVQRLVKPDRDRQSRSALKKRWWQFAEKQIGLYSKLDEREHVIAAAQTSKYTCFTFLPVKIVYSHKTIIFPSQSKALFTCLQSRIHQQWSLQFGSTLEDRPVYTPSDCFETFPFPRDLERNTNLKLVGDDYYQHRAALMIARNEGMTKTYNRFHDRSETAADIVRLRELHAAMDRAVLEVYGWHDLAKRAAPIFLDETNEDDHTYQRRLFWPSDFRDEVLGRLLALNAERHAEEVRLGIAPGMKGAQPETEDDEKVSADELAE